MCISGLVRIPCFRPDYHSDLRLRAPLQARSSKMARIKTNTDFAMLYFSPECTDWRRANLGGQTSINHAERHCSFDREEDAAAFKERWESEGYSPVSD